MCWGQIFPRGKRGGEGGSKIFFQRVTPIRATMFVRINFLSKAFFSYSPRAPTHFPLEGRGYNPQKNEERKRTRTWNSTSFEISFFKIGSKIKSEEIHHVLGANLF